MFDLIGKWFESYENGKLRWSGQFIEKIDGGYIIKIWKDKFEYELQAIPEYIIHKYHFRIYEHAEDCKGGVK